ncbi:Tubulin polyglutamylase ttll5 [Halocaridina rubra]|uniref:Tubulin--tyrosine ligase-like protein 5 n=1 Tax=Halocaridina rubra TaxID=373956 RepID=A0AAN8X083_HALRR
MLNILSMEKMSSCISSRSNSPVKSARKAEQKVQFCDSAEIRLHGHKVCGKPPEVPRAPPYCRSSSRMSASSSISSSSSCSSGGTRFSSSAGSTSSALDRINKSGDSKVPATLDRKRAGSLRQKSSDHAQRSDSSRSHSLDRRRGCENSRRESASPVNAGSERKRRECEGKDNHSKEKKPKTKSNGPSHSRSFSGERSKLPGRQKMAPPTLLPSGKSDHSKTVLEQKVSFQNDDKASNCKGSYYLAQQFRRAASRSPSRTFPEKSSKEDKENIGREKGRGDHKSHDKKERGRSLKRESRNSKASSSGKHKHEDVVTVIGDVMWWGTGSKRTGYLLFNYTNLNDTPKDPTPSRYTMTFKFSQADSKLIRMLMEAHGFSEVDSNSSFFNLYWGNAHFNPNEIRQLQEWQKVNHFPRSSELTRKDRLYMNIKRMQRQYGVKLFDFIPTSFILPTEYRDFCDTHLRERGTWIVKPVASSQGKGIYLINQVDQVPSDETSLVCRYIDTPLLVDGYKCDLRLYVAVTSLDPLVVYLYEEGLVRLATVKYQHGKNLWNPCIHLTNYSVNKFHSNYVQNEDPEVDDQGNKWSLSAFLRHLKSQGIDTGSMMRSIEDVIIKSLLAALYQMNTATNMFVPHSRNCFELYGFDILVDNQLKPWVLEVNLSPSLNIDQPLDLKIKSAMLADLFSLVGLQVVNPYTAKVSSRPSVFRKLPYLRKMFAALLPEELCVMYCSVRNYVFCIVP